MKFRYDREDDALMIWFSRKKIDYADQAGNIIVHFTKRGVPVLIEILEATKFLANASRVFPESIRSKVLVSSKVY